MTISLSNGASASTGQDGYYLFKEITNGNYTVTPSFDNYTFNPTSKSVIVDKNNVTGANFTGTIIVEKTYSISGTVKSQSGTGLAGVIVSLSNGTSSSTKTDGTYSFTGIVNGEYTVTPYLTGYTFSPDKISVTVENADKKGMDFIGTVISKTYSIYGNVKLSDGAGFAGVKIYLSSNDSTLTGQDGSYSFTGVPKDNYTVIPSLKGYYFDPESRKVIIENADITDVNFTGSLIPPDLLQ